MISLRLILLSAVFAVTYGCKCVKPTQQLTYCRASWITRAKILKSTVIDSSIQYTVDHQEIFKNETVELFDKVYTPAYTAACGVVDLEVGEVYLLAGTVSPDTSAELQITSCIFMPANDVHPGINPPTWSNVSSELYTRLQTQDFKPCPLDD
uniref:NTR domain-containing protein n=1 Tax=Panagrellus redivivus TaxID=6233 RepID=A0A7E4WE27_PANRE